MQAEPFLAIRAHGQRHSLGRLGRRGGDAHGGADEAAGLGRREGDALLRLDWEGGDGKRESANGRGCARARDPRRGPGIEKTLRPQIPRSSRSLAVDGSRAGNPSVRDAGAGARLTCATEALKDAVRDVMMSLTTYGRSRAVARVV